MNHNSNSKTLEDDFLREIGMLTDFYNGYRGNQHMADCSFIHHDEGTCDCETEIPKAKQALLAWKDAEIKKVLQQLLGELPKPFKKFDYSDAAWHHGFNDAAETAQKTTKAAINKILEEMK